MDQKERLPGTPGLGRRKIALEMECLLFPGEIEEIDHGLSKAEELLLSGNGLVILPLHFSLRDPLEALKVVFTNEVMSGQRVVAPIAYHHVFPGVGLLAKFLGIGAHAVVTPRTFEKMGPRAPKEGSGLQEYLDDALGTLAGAGILILAPQVTRQATLGKPQKALRLLALAAKRKKVENFGFMFMTLVPGEKGPFDYGRAGGWNWRQKFSVQAGPTCSLGEALAEAGDIRGLDAWAFAHLKEIAPPGYPLN
jgi:hypothetical protein